MRSGKLRHRVTLQKPDPSVTADEYGHKRPGAHVDVLTCDARIEPRTGRELLLAQQIQSEATHRVTVRFSPSLADMDTTWRVKFGTRYLVLIDTTDIDERNIVIEMTCKEGLTDE
jgi:SPP1 family predicted phage head-tail adaptor